MSAPSTPSTSENGGASPSADTRVRYRSIDIDGVSIFYREAGSREAPTILLLHGFPSSSHMFRDLIPLLAGDFHLIAPDYPGFGNSDAPPIDQFEYTFDHLADVMERFVEKMGLSKFALYAQDFGGPVGFRLASRHPEWITALIVQNANAYLEGVAPQLGELLRAVYERRSPETEAPILGFFTRETTLAQYQTGARDPSAMNPDAWNMDQAGLDRPGNIAVQLEIHANYFSNMARYPEWQAYFAKHQPPTLVTWGQGDRIFLVEGARAYARDLKDCDLHLLNTGHFALEEEHTAIAAHITGFMRARGIL